MKKNSINFKIILARLIRYFRGLDRISIVWYGMLFFVIILLISLASFTIIHHDFYKKLADAQQKTIVKNPESRGSISSSESSLHGVVAVSTNLGTLAIDPSQTGSTIKLLDFLSDTVLTEFCSHRSHGECQDNIKKYIKSEEPNLGNRSEIKTKIQDYIKKKMESPIESVFIAEINDEKNIEAINRMNEKSLFFVVNNLYVNPTLVTHGEVLAKNLSEIIGLPQEEILPKFSIRKKRYMEIIKKMNITTRDQVNIFLEKNTETTKKYLSDAISALGKKPKKSDVNKIKEEILLEHAVYPYIQIEPNLVRYYPEGETLGQITGFVDNEGIGRYGVEGYFENILQGENAIQIITKDEKGRYLRDYTSSGGIMDTNGANITLTIDRNIQKEISKKLESAVKRYQANRGSVIVTDPKTGAIISMVNYPSYDPNHFTDVYSMEPVMYSDYPRPDLSLFGIPLFVIDSQNGTLLHNIEGKRVKLREATEDEINNNAIQKFKYTNKYGLGNYQNSIISSIYEPGSVFKAITVAIGLDTGEIKPTDVYYDKNTVTIDHGGGSKTEISNYSKAKCVGYHTYTSALNWSCNIGMINIVEKVGRSLFDSYVRNFGFSNKTNITLDGEVSTQIEPQNKWSRVKFFNMSFGQGISVTMIQMAAAYNALANGGIYMQPYIIESIKYPNNKTIKTSPIPVRRVIKEESSKTITAMLVDGAKNGYAAAGAVPGYTMAGKTGTSQIPYKGTYENIKFRTAIGHTVTSYGGYAPAYNPKFVMIVALDRPRTSSDAEKTAAPLYAEIAEYLLKYYKIPKWQN